MLRKFLRDEGGATAIEYGLIAGFIALAIIAAVGMTGERLVALFENSYSRAHSLGRQVGPPCPSTVKGVHSAASPFLRVPRKMSRTAIDKRKSPDCSGLFFYQAS